MKRMLDASLQHAAEDVGIEALAVDGEEEGFSFLGHGEVGTGLVGLN